MNRTPFTRDILYHGFERHRWGKPDKDGYEQCERCEAVRRSSTITFMLCDGNGVWQVRKPGEKERC